MDEKQFYTLADYRECFVCGDKKARMLMDAAGVVRIGRKPVVPAKNHMAFLSSGDFTVAWPDSRRKARLIELCESNDYGDTD